MSQEALSPYLWIEGARWQANCLTFVKSDDQDEVLRCFGGDLTTGEQMTLNEAYQNEEFAGGHGDNNSFVLSGRIGEWVFTVEENNYQGHRHEVWQRASRGTEMVSIYWNINCDDEFIYAVDGQAVMTFELVVPEERGGSDPDRFLDYMLELPFDVGMTRASALALAARITGVQLKPDWFESEYRVVKVIPLPEEPYPEF